MDFPSRLHLESQRERNWSEADFRRSNLLRMKTCIRRNLQRAHSFREHTSNLTGIKGNELYSTIVIPKSQKSCILQAQIALAWQVSTCNIDRPIRQPAHCQGQPALDPSLIAHAAVPKRRLPTTITAEIFIAVTRTALRRRKGNRKDESIPFHFYSSTGRDISTRAPDILLN